MEELIKKLREETGDPEGDFDKAFIVDSGRMKTRFIYYFQYRKKKPDGAFTKKRYLYGVLMRYNPFTGEPLYENEDAC